LFHGAQSKTAVSVVVVAVTTVAVAVVVDGDGVADVDQKSSQVCYEVISCHHHRATFKETIATFCLQLSGKDTQILNHFSIPFWWSRPKRNNYLIS
jgi:hypothetical protein